MNIAPVTSGSTLDAVLSAWADAALHDAPPADGEAMPASPTAPGSEGPEAAGVQTLVRPPVVADAAPRVADAALPAASASLGDFALPASQLVPAALIGLQVEPAWGWPLPGHAPGRLWKPGTSPPAGDPPSHAHEDDAPAEAADEPEPPAREDTASAGDAEQVLDEGEGGDWCESLTRALGAALAARIPPRALLVAAEQWKRGRCVVLACPQGADPAGPAWAFVLWPRRQAPAGRAAAPALSLVGLRVEARLQWALPPVGAHWCHVRVVKEHHPRRGRQLVAPDSGAPVPCEVQLGPVLARSLHWCEVCLRIHAVRRFWSALGAQWSVHVVVCSMPLAGARPLPREDAAC